MEVSMVGWFLRGLLLLLFVLYKLSKRRNNFWQKLGVPCLESKSLMGHVGGVLTGKQHLSEALLDCYNEAGDAPYSGMFALNQPLLLVKDPALVGCIFASDFTSFNSRHFTLDQKSDTLLAKSLFGLQGSKWKALRIKLAPAFTAARMKKMFTLVNEVGEDMSNHISAEIDKGRPIDVWQLMARYTAHVVSSVLMGVDPGSLAKEDTPAVQHVLGILREDWLAQTSQALSFLAPKLLWLLPFKFASPKEEAFWYMNTVQMINDRKQKGIVRNDIVDLLIQLSHGGLSTNEDTGSNNATENLPAVDLNDEAIVGNILAFLTAGFDTSASTMTFALYELALHQDEQDRLRQHIRQVVANHGGQITYEALAEMAGLTNVINETLRLHPPLGLLDRRSTRPYQLPSTGAVLPEGTGVVVSLLGMHRDPRYWPQPYRFLPERFSEEQAASRRRFTFMPFGDGPRQCIGYRMGVMQTKAGLAHILNSFRVSSTDKTPVPVTVNQRRLIATPSGSLQLCFEKIE